MVDIVLIDPGAEICDRESDQVESLHLAEMIAYLRQLGLTTNCIQARQNNLTIEKAVLQTVAQKPLCISVWALYRSLDYTKEYLAEFSRCFKGTRPLILVEGNAATFSAQSFIENIPADHLDGEIVGEAEKTLGQVILALKCDQDWRQVPGIIYRDRGTRSCFSGRTKLNYVLDQFPHPIRIKKQFRHDEWVEVRGSRGCYHNCSFCNIRPFYAYQTGPHWRGHSPEYIVDEVKSLYQQGARRFYFVDDMFFGPGASGKRRVRQIADQILKMRFQIEWQIFCRVSNIEFDLFRWLKKAGLSTVNIGLECATESQLNRMDKGQTVAQAKDAIAILRQLQLLPVPSFIMFDPYVTLEEIKANIHLISELNFLTFLGPGCIIPFEGTALTKRLATDNLLDWQNPLVPDYLPNARMQDQRVDIVRLAWSSWRSWVDNNFQNLGTTLSRIAYEHDMGAVSSKNPTLYQISQKIKKLEISYVLTSISAAEKEAKLEELLDLRQDWFNQISEINEAFHDSFPVKNLN